MSADEPKEVRFPALTRLVAETLKGSQVTDDFLKESTNRHELKIARELRKARPVYQFIHVFHRWIKPVFAEFVATFMLLFWACMLQPQPSGPDQHISYQMMPALSAGIALIIIITVFWDICVIQFNPAVTVSLVLAEVLPFRLMLPNIIAQLAGATLASFIAAELRGYPVGMIPITSESNVGAIIWAEILFTFAMNFATAAALLDDKYAHQLTPYVIGMTVFQGVLGGWHVGAGCMNPARVFGPAVIGNEWGKHWVWWTSEIVGACLAVIIVRLFFAPLYASDEKSGLWWWRVYQRIHQPRKTTKKSKKKNFSSWAAVYRRRNRNDQVDDENNENDYGV